MATIVNSREIALQATVPRVLTTDITLTRSATTFTRTKNIGTIAPASITITATATVAGVFSTPNYEWRYSIVPGTWVLISSGSSNILTITNSTYTGYVATNAVVSYRCTVTETGRITVVSYADILYIKETDDPINIEFTNPSPVVGADSVGVASIFTNTGTIIKVLKGSTYLAYGASGSNTFSVGTPVVSPANLTLGSPGTTSDSYTRLDAVAMTADFVTVTYPITVRDITGTNLPITYNAIQKFSKVKQLNNAEVSGTYGDAATLGVNGSFENWTGAYPTNWVNWTGAAPTKETTVTRNGVNAAKYVAIGTNVGMQINTIDLANRPLPTGSYLTGTVDFHLIAYSSGFPAVLIRMFTSATITGAPFTDVYIQPKSTQIGVWQRVPFTARVDNGAQIYGIQVYAMGSYGSSPVPNFSGTVCFDNIDFSIQQSDVATNPATMDLSSYSFVLPADSTGLVASPAGFSGAVTTATVYRRGVDDSTNWTFTRSASDGSITSTPTGTPSGRIVTVNAIGTSVDAGYIDITATPNSTLAALGYVAITQRFSLSKNKAAVRAQGVYNGLALSTFKAVAGATAYSGVRFLRDGPINSIGGASATTYTDEGYDWYGPTATTNIGDNYWIKVLNQSGTAPTVTGLTLGTWSSLSTAKSIYISQASSGTSTSSNTFSIALDAAGAVGSIVASGTIYLEAERG